MTAIARRAAAARVAPWVLFAALWITLRFTQPLLMPWAALAAAALLLYWRRAYGELARSAWPTPRMAALAVALGVALFFATIHLEQPWMRFCEAQAGFRPVDGEGNPLWAPLAAYWLGTAFVVPLAEELAWRSWLMRRLDATDFAGFAAHRTSRRAMLLSSIAFASMHSHWLAALIGGLTAGWLYRRSGTLWAPALASIIAHALLGGWVAITGNWGYW